MYRMAHRGIPLAYQNQLPLSNLEQSLRVSTTRHCDTLTCTDMQCTQTSICQQPADSCGWTTMSEGQGNHIFDGPSTNPGRLDPHHFY